jgi:hypothetical protein
MAGLSNIGGQKRKPLATAANGTRLYELALRTRQGAAKDVFAARVHTCGAQVAQKNGRLFFAVRIPGRFQQRFQHGGLLRNKKGPPFSKGGSKLTHSIQAAQPSNCLQDLQRSRSQSQGRLGP